MARTKQFDKEQVLEKAKALFWKQGFHATSIQNLVDHLGINRASLYDTFGGKNELYEAAFQAYQKHNIKGLIHHFEAYPSAKEGLIALFLKSMQDSIDDDERKGCFVVNCTTEYLPNHQHMLAELINNKRLFEEIISVVLQRGKENGEFPDHLITKDLATYLFTFISGLKVIGKLDQNPEALRKTIEVGLSVLDK